MMPMLSLLALDSRFVAFIALAKLHVVLLGVVVVWKTVFVVMGGVAGKRERMTGYAWLVAGPSSYEYGVLTTFNYTNPPAAVSGVSHQPRLAN